MKSIISLFTFCTIIFFATACKKTGAGENPQPETNYLIGTWHVKNYIAANLTNGQPNDTVAATHNEIFVFTKDSLFADSWISLFDDYTKTPPVFKVIDTIEYKGAYSYTRNGSVYIIKSSGSSETINIVNLTSTQLKTDENIQVLDPNSICKDLVLNFEK